MSELHQLIVSFPDQSESFVLGFEAGIIHETMTNGRLAEFEKTTHTLNKEIIERLCVAYGWSAELAPSSVDGWHWAKFTKTKAPDRLNPMGLRLVKENGDE